MGRYQAKMAFRRSFMLSSGS
uniref:Uncharacterized protein n=1 Tax=Anguilla anguilla TaxID=7936 RepID=A0A0E9P6R1_ANGAN